MPSGYSRNLGLELMLTGENAGTWGDVTNINLNALDDAIDGVADITVGPGGITITTANAPATSDGRSKVLNFSGTLTAEATVTFAPDDSEKHYFVRNLTGHPLVFAQGSGLRYTVNAGYSAVVHCNGMGLEASVYGTLSSFQTDKLVVKGPLDVTGTIAITGAVTLTGEVTMQSTLTVAGAAQFNSNVGVAGTLAVTGASTFTGAAQFNSNVGVAGTLAVAGAATIHSVQVNTTLNVAGAATLASLGVTGAVTVAPRWALPEPPQQAR